MWAYEHDDGCMTQDYGVEFKFNQSSHVSHLDQNLMLRTLGYVENIQEIIQVEFSLFQCVIFRCKWWDTFHRNNVKEYHDSVMISINCRKMWHEARETYFSQNIATRHCFTQMCWIGIGSLY